VTAPDPWLDHPERVPGDARRLTALMPALAAALWRLRNGMSPIAPDATKGVAADYLRMVTGSEPTAAHARALEQYLILTVDHGFNASTFTARVVASTGTDLASAYTGAYSTFIGPLHGGAPSLVLDMLHAIGSPANAKPFIERQLASGNRLMGFGHRIYRVDDPRAMLLRDVALDLGGDLATLAETVEREALDALAKAAPSKPLRTNVEFWASVVMSIVGLPGEMFTPTFAVSRSVGWAAHLTEQTSRNRLIRPASRYVGPDAPVPLP
jgi:citrate synthase